jgi:predicted GNAT family N-acyltransferase
MTTVAVRLVDTAADLAAAYAIRDEVFVVEQGVPVELERDERDADAEHFLVLVDGEAVAAGRLVVEDAGYEGIDRGLGSVGHLGRLAVRAPFRGSGLGVALVDALVERARERGLRALYLGAQTHAVGFYRRLGFAVTGEVFDDAGIPHRHMVRVL